MGSIPGLTQWVKDLAQAVAHTGCRCGSDLVLLWLWHRLAAAAPIQPLVRELPYATSATIKKKKKKRKKSFCKLVNLFVNQLYFNLENIKTKPTKQTSLPKMDRLQGIAQHLSFSLGQNQRYAMIRLLSHIGGEIHTLWPHS